MFKWLFPLIFFLFVVLFFYSSQPASRSSALPTIKSAPTLYYPLTNFVSRLQLRKFGTLVTPADQRTLPCGQTFSGFHNGDDLETAPEEASANVPVFAIAPGTIVQISWVPGYGGLLIARHFVSGQEIMANYGHLNLESIPLKVGDSVSPGERLAFLGKACSPETDGERKHLHFSLYFSSHPIVAGYVSRSSDLQSWIDPASYLSSHGAHNPTP